MSHAIKIIREDGFMNVVTLLCLGIYMMSTVDDCIFLFNLFCSIHTHICTVYGHTDVKLIDITDLLNTTDRRKAGSVSGQNVWKRV